MFVSANLCALASGLHFGWPSPAKGKLESSDFHLNISSDESSYITIIAPFGYLIGGPISSILVDVIGRKCVLLLISIPQISAWLLIAFSNTIVLLYIARFLTGIAEGALFTVLPMYLCEIADPRIRGVLGSSLSVAFIGGILLINCYGSYVSIYTGALISISIPLLFILTFTFMPESPYYFLMRSRNEDAKKTLKRLRMKEDVEDELDRLSKDVQRQISQPGRIKDLFMNATNRKAFFIILGLRTIQVYSGLAAFNVYTQMIFEKAGGHVSPSVSSIIYTATQMSVTFFGSILADKFGRKPMVILSCAISASLLVVEGFYFYFQEHGSDMTAFKVVPLIGMMLYIVSFSLGLGVAPNLMLGELFAANVKAKALSIMTIYFAISISTSSKLFHFLDLHFGMHVPFFTFSVVCFSGILFGYYCLPETKGKTLEEIQQILRGCNNNNSNSNADDDKKDAVKC